MDSDSDLVILFETHATSLDNEAGLASGWFDVALSPTGEEQARALGVRRRDDDLAAVFCSDLSRSFRTAEIAFRHRQVSILHDARLRECDYGALNRRPASEIEERRATCIDTPFPGGRAITRSWIGSPGGSRRLRVRLLGARYSSSAIGRLSTRWNNWSGRSLCVRP